MPIRVLKERLSLFKSRSTEFGVAVQKFGEDRQQRRAGGFARTITACYTRNGVRLFDLTRRQKTSQ
jgi:hypothetical protein